MAKMCILVSAKEANLIKRLAKFAQVKKLVT